jgi:hypothetical protein
MTFRAPAAAAVLALLGLSAANPAAAQPVPLPSPPRPAFSPYLNLLGPWGIGYGYFGLAQPQINFMQQQFEIQQQLQSTTQNLANLQNAVNYGLVNPYLPVTGRGATFNNLGHWYPMARNSSGAGYGGGYGVPRVLPRSGLGAYGATTGAYGGYGSGFGGYGGVMMNAPIRR